MAYTKTIFKEITTIKLEIQAEPTKFSKKHKEFITMLETYLKERQWYNKPIELEIYKRYYKMSAIEIANDLDITYSNYKVILNRMTTRLNSILFFGNTLTDVFYCTDGLDEHYDTLYNLLYGIDIKTEFTDDVIRLVDEEQEQNNIDTELERQFILLLALSSKDIQDKLKEYTLDDNIKVILQNLSNRDILDKYRLIKKSLVECDSLKDILYIVNKEIELD